jgi:hypothetical protein
MTLVESCAQTEQVPTAMTQAKKKAATARESNLVLKLNCFTIETSYGSIEFAKLQVISELYRSSRARNEILKTDAILCNTFHSKDLRSDSIDQ